MPNLDGYTKGNNEWAQWVKFVKKCYKEEGHTLTQQQALILASKTYDKGNVLNNINNKNLNTDLEIPENPVRQKKEPAPKKKPMVYKRERSPPKNRKYYDYSSEEEEYYEPRRRYKYQPRPKSPHRRVRREEYYDSSEEEYYYD